MDDPKVDIPKLPLPELPEGRLDSWKKIASHLKRDVSTVQRWERREGMPVHRLVHDKRGSVYAFRSELDAWWVHRSTRLVREQPGQNEAGKAVAEGPPPQHRWFRHYWIAVLAGASLATITGLWVLRDADYFWHNPLANAKFISVTELEGNVSAAAISRDGEFVAYLGDQSGVVDAWVTKIGSGKSLNLTAGTVSGLANPTLRTPGFSPDASLVSIWTRHADGSKPDDVNILAAPITGGPLATYLPGAAEFDWSNHGKRLVYHTTAPGDPLFVREPGQVTDRNLYTAPAGVHCHFPIWSTDDAFIYFARGVPPDHWDIWRVPSAGGTPERITQHNTRVTHPVLLDRQTLLYLATDADGSGPWVYAMDVERRVPHRAIAGIERYTSLAASANGTRIVATAASGKTSLWRVPIAETTVGETGAGRIALPGGGLSPRLGPAVMLYVASRGGRTGIWGLVDGKANEIWSESQSRIIGAPAIAPDYKRVAFTTEIRGRQQLHVMNIDGTGRRLVNDSLELRGDPAWMPDGQSLLSAAVANGETRLTKFPLSGAAPLTFIPEYSISPVWSRDGKFMVYSGADVGTTFPLRAAAADGRVHALPNLVLTRGARRVSFVNGSRSLVILRGGISEKNFWLMDLETGAERQLTNFGHDFVIQDFDVSADGREIVFDRLQDHSEMVLIERAP